MARGTGTSIHRINVTGLQRLAASVLKLAVDDARGVTPGHQDAARGWLSGGDVLLWLGLVALPDEDTIELQRALLRMAS